MPNFPRNGKSVVSLQAQKEFPTTLCCCETLGKDEGEPAFPELVTATLCRAHLAEGVVRL
jgi:hypothetical protein